MTAPGVPPSNVTMRDVAERAGVSTASVSRVLSGARPVTGEVDERVRRAASELGYRMHHTARSLRRQRTGIVGMVVPHITNPFFPALVDAVEQHLHEADGLSLMLCDSHDDPALERARLSSFQRGRVDGLLVIPSHVAASAAAINELASHLPVVQVDRWADGAAADAVATDHRAAMTAVVDHLVATGRRRFAFVGAARTNMAARERHAGMTEAITAHGVALVATLEGTYTADFGEHAATRLLDRGKVPDAIVCGNDLIALGVLRALARTDLRVPDDVAVTGVDGIDFADLATPRLTTIVQPVVEVAATAVEQLRARLGGHAGEPRLQLLPGRLRVAASSASEAGDADPASSDPDQTPDGRDRATPGPGAEDRS